MITDSPPGVDRQQLEQLVAGLVEGVILCDPDGAIVWANAAALAMHHCDQLDGLGHNPRSYHQRFALTHRNHRALAAREYPLARLAAGSQFEKLAVELRPPAATATHSDASWT